MIYGIGIDIAEVKRLAESIDKWGERFVTRIFSPAEIAYCDSRPLPAMHYAARFAAKESLLKALGIGLGMGLSLKDIEVSANAQGRPEIGVSGRGPDMLRERGVRCIHLSLSHTRHSATALVVLER